MGPPRRKGTTATVSCAFAVGRDPPGVRALRTAPVKTPFECADYRIVIYNRHTVAGVLLLAAVVSPLAAPASGRHAPCQCVTAPDALLESTDAVFIGDLLEVKRTDGDDATAVIRVKESFK